MSTSIHRTYNKNHIQSVAKQMQFFFLSNTYAPSVHKCKYFFFLKVFLREMQVFLTMHLDKYLFKYDILQKYSYFSMDAVYSIS